MGTMDSLKSSFQVMANSKDEVLLMHFCNCMFRE